MRRAQVIARAQAAEERLARIARTRRPTDDETDEALYAYEAAAAVQEAMREDAQAPAPDGAERTRRATLAATANRVAAESRNRGAPSLTLYSDADDLGDWLQWCDRNGSHTAGEAIADGCDPYTPSDAWEALEMMLDDAS